tara:strand:+ start:278 stop:718 length:441 start_codon:yes stop_codon:yes gene_type:complete
MKKKEKFSQDIKRRSSRKAYLFYYLMAFTILASIGFIYFKENLVLNKIVLIISLVFVFSILKFTEVHRLLTSYTLTPTALEFSTGIVMKNVQRITYGSISDVGVIQSPWQRVLNTGDLMVSQFAENLLIKNINKPNKFLEEITKRI